MKNTTQIITSLQNKPQFSKLSKFKYIQNNTLFFMLNHNLGNQEFNNNVVNIKSALNFHMPR